MKKFTMQDVRKMVANPPPYEAARDLRPFPGKYPTRLIYEFTFVDGSRLSCLTKPSLPAILRFVKYWRQPWTKCAAFEFDKRFVIQTIRSKRPIETWPRAFVYASIVGYRPHGNYSWFLMDWYTNMRANRTSPNRKYVPFIDAGHSPRQYSTRAIEVPQQPVQQLPLPDLRALLGGDWQIGQAPVGVVHPRQMEQIRAWQREIEEEQRRQQVQQELEQERVARWQEVRRRRLIGG